MIERKDEIKKVAEKILENSQHNELEDLFKNNFKIWKVGEINYRVHFATHEDFRDLDDALAQEYTRLMRSPNYLHRCDWIKMYEEKGTGNDKYKNLEDLDDRYNEISRELNELSPKIVEEVDDVARNRLFEGQYIPLVDEQYELSQLKKHLLRYSIEDKLNWFTNLYGVYLTLDIEVDGKFQRKFKSFDEFMKVENSPELEDIILTATRYFKTLNHPKEL